jgi:hypothetical protein
MMTVPPPILVRPGHSYAKGNLMINYVPARSLSSDIAVCVRHAAVVAWGWLRYVLWERRLARLEMDMLEARWRRLYRAG